MSGDDQPTPPPVIWAQRSNVILLTICLEDCKNPHIVVNNDKVYFKGKGGPDNKTYEVTINLYKEVDRKVSFPLIVRDRNIELYLAKQEEGPFWPRLTKEKVKYHWLKIDFNKWKDEDDSDDDVEDRGHCYDSLLRDLGNSEDDEAAGDCVADFKDMFFPDGEIPDLE